MRESPHCVEPQARKRRLRPGAGVQAAAAIKPVSGIKVTYVLTDAQNPPRSVRLVIAFDTSCIGSALLLQLELKMDFYDAG